MKLFDKGKNENKPFPPPKPTNQPAQQRPAQPPKPGPPGPEVMHAVRPGFRLPPLRVPHHPGAPGPSPPLFIKIDKYREVLKNIRNLRSYILNLRDALDVLEDMQKELSNGIHIAQRTLDELNVILSSLDSFFLKPQAVEHEDMDEREEAEEREEKAYKPVHPEAPAPKQVEGYVKDVYGELEKLRSQLKTLR